MTVCPQCGEHNPERFRICGMCGAPLGTATVRRESRKTVTVVFSDLKGSTRLGEHVDSEALREALGRYFDEMRSVIERHGGAVEKYIGDAIMAVFGLPTVREDDALRAVRAARDMQRRLADLNSQLGRQWGIELESRIGVNTGEVVAGDASAGQRMITGDTVNTAARLEQAAPGGAVLIGHLTYVLVRGDVEVEAVEPLTLKGKAEAVAAYRVLAVRAPAPRPLRFEAPLVGRADELARLNAAEREVRDAGRARLVTVVAEAGVGKSRLIHEFLMGADLAQRSLRGRCLSYGDGITFWPIAEAIRAAAALEDDLPRDLARQRVLTLADGRADVAERIDPLLGLSDDVFPLEDIFWAIRTLLEGLARPSCLVVVLDDLHWAERTLLELIDHIRTNATAPILIIASARPQLLEEGASWLTDGELIRLRPLSDGETSAIATNILGAAKLPSELLSRITAASEGNPLFVEQVIAMLVDSGRLVRDDRGGWHVDGASTSIAVAPGIAALIDARLDRLASNDREVLQAGSVIGLVFYRHAVSALARATHPSIVDASIDRLTHRQFIRADASAFLDGDAFRFDHALIREAAYRSLLKRERAELHERFGTWLERAGSERFAELEEIIGYHFEQAIVHLRELGPLSVAAQRSAEKAATHLATAGRRALARGDSQAAVTLLERAAALLPDRSAARVEVMLDVAESAADLGEIDRSTSATAEALVTARALGDALLVTNASLVSLFLRYTIDPGDESARVISEVEEAIVPLEIAGEHRGLVRAWRLLAWVHGTACRYGAAERAVERAVHHARLAGDRRAETRNLMSFAVSAVHGPTSVAEAYELVRRIADDVGGDQRAEAIVLSASSHLAALRGEFDEARRLYRQAREMLESLGGRVMAATVSLDSGRVELLAGDAEAAERELRFDYETLETVGERYTLSTVAGLLGYAVLRQGRRDEALRASEVAEDMAAADDVESQSLWRRVRAVASVPRSPTAAITLAEYAYELVADTDAPLMKGYALLDLGDVLQAAGREDEATRRWHAALGLMEAKGALVPAGWVRTRLRIDHPAAK